MNSYPSSFSKSPSDAFDKLAEPVQRWIWDRGWGELHDVPGAGDIHPSGRRKRLDHRSSHRRGQDRGCVSSAHILRAGNAGRGRIRFGLRGASQALINDQLGRMEDLCKRTDLPVYPWHGDISQGVKSRARANPKGILLITPESLEAMFVLRGLQIPSLFIGTRAIIIDELHALLDNERGVHLRSLLSRLEHAVGPTDQTSGPVCHIERHGNGP